MTGHPAVPASRTQRQFWLLQQLQPDSTAYHIPCLWKVAGALDIDALEAAFRDLAMRHATLRTTFSHHAHTLFQHVGTCTQIDIQVEDCSPEAEAQRIATAVHQKFDLVRGPLWRVRLYRTGWQRYTLIWVLHHILVDLATKQLFSVDLARAYRNRTQSTNTSLDTSFNTESSVPTIPESCLVDFAKREAAWLESQAYASCEAYFTEHLRERTAPLSLPADFARPKYRPRDGACIQFDLDRDLCSRMSECCTSIAAKPYLWLLTAWGLILARYGATDQVAIGVPFSNRRIWQCAMTAGCFVNTLPVIFDVDRNEPFAQTLKRLRTTMLGHHRHQEIGLEQIVAALKLPHDVSRNPLYQAGFTFEPPMQLALAELDVTSVKLHNDGAQLDVFLTLWPTPEGYSGQLEYASELFLPKTAQRLVDSYITLLQHVTQPGVQESTPVQQLRVLSENERHTILESFNATVVQFAAPAKLHHLFLEQAHRDPAAVALRYCGRHTTFGELIAQAQYLAHSLRLASLSPGEHVGVYMLRSPEMVVAIVAILIAGGVYLPIDPDYPTPRIERILEDARPRHVLTHAAVAGNWPGPRELVRHVNIDQLTTLQDPLENVADSNDAAYTIFTSGSTGRPKGATNTHRGIINRILWMQQAFGLDKTDVVLQKTPFSFDVSTWEFFWPLAVGAVLEIAPAGVHRDPGVLCQLIRDTGVTTIHFVPSMLDAFLNHPLARQCHNLRRIISSGEALSNELVRRCASTTSAELHNLYGPTEAAVDVTWWPCASDPTRSPVPIGKPIANTTIYLLDSQGQPVPIGVPGELHIGGVQIALGYVNRPELTAKQFVPNPFSDRPGARLYRTGDLARWMPDGNIVYLGRTDHQVKLRGHRIELGEIEQVLGSCPGVRQSVVLLRELSETQKNLIAYLTLDTHTTMDDHFLSVVKTHVSRALPSYMVPSQFHALTEFPLTASGKIDRAALPEPVPQLVRENLAVAPSTPLEKWLLDQVQELLGLAPLSVKANLFELGGSSMTVAQLVGRIFECRGLEIPLVKFFEHPTIAGMASYLTELQNGQERTNDALTSAKSKARQRREREVQGGYRPPPRRA